MDSTKPILSALLLIALALAGCSDGGGDQSDGTDGDDGPDDAMDGMDKQDDEETGGSGVCATNTESQESNGITVHSGAVGCDDAQGGGSNEVSIDGCGSQPASVATAAGEDNEAKAGTVQVVVTSGGSTLYDETFTAEEVNDVQRGFTSSAASGYTLTVTRSDDWEGGLAVAVTCFEDY